MKSTFDAENRILLYTRTQVKEPTVRVNDRKMR